MIPRALPTVASIAIRNGWGVEVTNDGTRVSAVFQRHGPHRTDTVWLQWHEGTLRESRINDHPTPYADCVRLIKEDQE